MTMPSAGIRNVAQVLEDLESSANGSRRAAGLATGFQPLDRTLGGGFRTGDLVLLGGSPGVGKTIAALQCARNVAASGRPAVYACYEHDQADLLTRLLLLELGTLARPEDAPVVDDLRHALAEVADGQATLREAAAEHPLLQAAQHAVAGYAEHLWLVRASGRHTGVGELEELTRRHPGSSPPALFVDYLQKVALGTDALDEAEKVTRVVAGLKDLALTGLTVVALVAADRASLDARRLHLHHLRGSSALAYEADVILLMNEKRRAVADVHVDYDPARAEQFSQWVIFSVEKNRSGPTQIDVELRKDFAHFRFDPHGRYVAEQLIDARLRSPTAG